MAGNSGSTAKASAQCLFHVFVLMPSVGPSFCPGAPSITLGMASDDGVRRLNVTIREKKVLAFVAPGAQKVERAPTALWNS